MQLEEALLLIQHSIPLHKNIWADLGCGDGLFTHALSHLLPEKSLIYAVDKNKTALKNVSVKPGIQLEKIVADFVHDELPFKTASGILMANSFHYVQHKNAFIEKCLAVFNNNAYFVIVEYDLNKANPWVPFPISFNDLKKFFSSYNFAVEKLHEMPSRYRGKMYAALIQQQYKL
jgi:ubiquinone/menaquinone biosynthesis C-methylase UbiE